MFRSIVVPLDGSSWSERALPLAQTLAAQAGARLALVHVHIQVIHPVSGYNLGGVAYIDEGLDREARAREAAYLATLRDRITRESGVEVTSDVVDGPVAQTLADYAAHAHADLVVMTTHGRGAFSRVWLGGIADSFIRHSPTPTLLVRPHDDTPQALPPTIRHLLIPLDESPLAEQIVEPAATLARLVGARITLLEVVDPLHVPSYTIETARELEPTYTESRAAEAAAYLRGIATQLQAQEIAVETRVVVAAQPATEILDLARSRGVDVIALATHGRGGLTRLLIGSVADKVVRGADVPVLVYRPTPGATTPNA
jgi:nucleotide-binding universal stress UspA family protein